MFSIVTCCMVILLLYPLPMHSSTLIREVCKHYVQLSSPCVLLSAGLFDGVHVDSMWLLKWTSMSMENCLTCNRGCLHVLHGFQQLLN